MEPKLSRVIELQMVEANSRISNFTSLFVRPNEFLNVTCLIEAPHETDFVYWYKNKDPIQFDNLKLRRAVSRQDSRERQTSSGKKASQTGGSKLKSTYITAGSSSHRQSNSKVLSRTNDSSEQQNLNAKRSNENERLTENGPIYSDTNEEEEEEEKAEEDNGSNSNDFQDEKQPLLLRSSSSLTIKQTQLNDTANYTCLVSSPHLFVFPFYSFQTALDPLLSMQASMTTLLSWNKLRNTSQTSQNYHFVPD